MKKIKILTATAAAALFVSGFVVASAAEEPEMSAAYVSVPVTDDIELPDSDELFNSYVKKTFYGDSAVFAYSATARKNLSEAEAKIYDALKTEIEKIAKGSLSSTIITLADSLLPKSTFTPSELSVSEFNSTTIDTAKKNITSEKLGFDFAKICIALMHDCPYELYWFDKTEGYGMGYGISYSTGSLNISNLQFSFIVAKEYSDTNAIGTYKTNTTKTSAATTAAANAAEVISNNAGKTDIEKLHAYKDYICEKVSYNDDAAKDNTTPYGNPWQLIWVFDDNTTTNVVCEGYSKAFQYLCDLSAFNSEDIYCISVTGNMTSSGGGGPHMWNVMHMDDGKNYLVDVTNTDGNSIGNDGSLFLKGYSSTAGSTSYTFNNNNSNSVTFVYDGNTTALYSADELALSDDNYHWDYNGDGICDETNCGKIINGFGANLAGYTLSLKGNIGVNFYMELSEEITDSATAYMQFTLPGGAIEKVLVSAAEKDTTTTLGKTYYVFPCEVAAKEMTDTIKAQMFDGNGKSGIEYTYTVKDYADYIIANPGTYGENAVALVKAMLNYGAYSQQYFGYNTGNLANAGISLALPDITAANLSTYAPQITKNESVATFIAAYLSLKSETAANVKVQVTGTPAVTVNGSAVSLASCPKSGEYYVLTVDNIPANQLDKMYTFTLTSGGNTASLNFSALSYCYMGLNNSGASDKLKNLCKSIYAYNLAADTYNPAA